MATVLLVLASTNWSASQKATSSISWNAPARAGRSYCRRDRGKGRARRAGGVSRATKKTTVTAIGFLFEKPHPTPEAQSSARPYLGHDDDVVLGGVLDKGYNLALRKEKGGKG